MRKLILFFLLFYAAAVGREEDFNSGTPFGQISPSQINDLFAFAKSQGFDLRRDLDLAYGGDDGALDRVFGLSVKFDKLDNRARAYGQIVYSSFLNLAEKYGVEGYSRVIVRQPAAVRQRIRDFIFYDATQAPERMRQRVQSEARKSAPILFPEEYTFAADDPIFQTG